MSNFSDWVKTAWTNLLSWFGVEEQKAASFLYPIFQDIKALVKKDILHDIADGIPVVVIALTSGGIPAAIEAAIAYILPVLEAQSAEIAQTSINTLANALVAQAQASVDATATIPAA